jgi:preprotein translocase subunit SecF
MQPYSKLTPFLLLLFVLTISFAQETPKHKINSINEGSIEEQFDYISRISSNYNDKGKRYEVINRIYFESLKTNVIDSLKVLENQIIDSNKTIEAQEKSNSAIQNELENTKVILEKTDSEKDKISLFGMQLSKGLYNIMLWSIIGVLLLLVFTFIYKFKSSNSITKAAKKSLEETEQEFEEHRRVALEREQKVRRQLQDEINKQKGNT